LGKKVLFDNQKVELVKSLERQAIQKRVEPIKEQNVFKFGKTDPVLFEKMRKLRLEIAKRENKAPYMIFSDNTLQQLAAVKPKQLKEFTTIEGIGNHKKDLYGAPFLQLILENN
jgi:ATP-dependent DNA helicase RecQ